MTNGNITYVYTRWLNTLQLTIGCDYLGWNETKAAALIRWHGMLCNDIFPSTQWPGIDASMSCACVYSTTLFRQAFDQWCIFITRFELSAEYHAIIGMFLASYVNYVFSCKPCDEQIIFSRLCINCYTRDCISIIWIT